MKYFYMLLLIMTTWLIRASDDYNFKFDNNVYDDYIKTVTLEINNVPTNFPIMTLKAGQFVMLKFDDLLNEERVLYYRIIHCNQDWQPSRLRDIEFIAGFNDERLRNYEYSSNTRMPYLHYWQQFPNKDTQIKVSGNYLVVIYEDKIEYPILTRRFIVTENQVNINIKNTFPGDVENIRYKQELEVNINYEKFKMRNPVDEISIVVLQNQNWHSSITAKPSFFSNSLLKFNRIKTFSWWGLAEYREFDTRSLIRNGRNVKFIERSENISNVTLSTDLPRRNKVHLSTFDFNGRFFNENFERAGFNTITDVLDTYANTVLTDESLRNSARDSIVNSISTRNALLDSDYQAEERNIRSDYANVTFFLDDNININNESIYVLGGMNNWLPSEEFRMRYDAKRDMYTCEALLKQGYYNYFYGLVNENGDIDYVSMEGSWNETENDYQAIVYYRGIGDLFDRVIGYREYNTNTGLLNIR